MALQRVARGDSDVEGVRQRRPILTWQNLTFQQKVRFCAICALCILRRRITNSMLLNKTCQILVLVVQESFDRALLQQRSRDAAQRTKLSQAPDAPRARDRHGRRRRGGRCGCWHRRTGAGMIGTNGGVGRSSCHRRILEDASHCRTLNVGSGQNSQVARLKNVRYKEKRLPCRIGGP